MFPVFVPGYAHHDVTSVPNLSLYNLQSKQLWWRITGYLLQGHNFMSATSCYCFSNVSLCHLLLLSTKFPRTQRMRTVQNLSEPLDTYKMIHLMARIRHVLYCRDKDGKCGRTVMSSGLGYISLKTKAAMQLRSNYKPEASQSIRSQTQHPLWNTRETPAQCVVLFPSFLHPGDLTAWTTLTVASSPPTFSAELAFLVINRTMEALNTKQDFCICARHEETKAVDCAACMHNGPFVISMQVKWAAPHPAAALLKR